MSPKSENWMVDLERAVASARTALFDHAAIGKQDPFSPRRDAEARRRLIERIRDSREKAEIASMRVLRLIDDAQRRFADEAVKRLNSAK